MALIPRYVLFEVVKIFIVALLALTLLVIVGFVGREAADQGLPVMPTLRLIPYFLPDTLRVTVPMTLLLACTSVYSRMSGANEIVALKALGISPLGVLWPVFVLAFILSLVTVWLNDIAVSWGHDSIERVVLESAEEIAYSMLRQNHSYSTSNFSINVKNIEGRELQRCTVSIQGHGDGAALTTIEAESAELRSDRERHVLQIVLRNGVVDVGGRMRVDFPDVREYEVPLADASRAQSTADPANIALRYLNDEISRQQALLVQQEQSMAARASMALVYGDFGDLTGKEWQADEDRRNELRARVARLQAEPPRRWSAGFACFCFVWVGAPLAIRLRNRDFLTSFFLCFLPILLVYYPLMIYGVAGSKTGTVPAVTAWAGDLLLLLWGGTILRRVVRY